MQNAAEHRRRNEVPAPRATKILTAAEVEASGSGAAIYAIADRSVLLDIPVIPNIDAKILQQIEADPASFWMGDWHFYGNTSAKCGTSHCRAGWAIVLAGDAGKALEVKLGPSAAGALIYVASRPGEKVPDFFCDQNVAIDDIRACAAKQLASAP